MGKDWRCLTGDSLINDGGVRAAVEKQEEDRQNACTAEVAIQELAQSVRKLFAQRNAATSQTRASHSGDATDGRLGPRADQGPGAEKPRDGVVAGSRASVS